MQFTAEQQPVISMSSSSVHPQSGVPLFSSLQSLRAPVQGRTLYLSRHGESLYNLEQRIGGNPELSVRGHQYAKVLGDKINSMDLSNLEVWTSELVRTHQTVRHINRHIGSELKSYAALNELDSGSFNHLTYDQFEQLHPLSFLEREQNKLTYRYPRGESYVDLCRRIETVLPDMDDKHNLLVICHQAVIRCIMAFLQRRRTLRDSRECTSVVSGSEAEDELMPYIRVPLHTLIKVTFNGHVNEFEFIPLKVECVDTHRPSLMMTQPVDALPPPEKLNGDGTDNASPPTEGQLKEQDVAAKEEEDEQQQSMEKWIKRESSLDSGIEISVT